MTGTSIATKGQRMATSTRVNLLTRCAIIVDDRGGDLKVHHRTIGRAVVGLAAMLLSLTATGRRAAAQASGPEVSLSPSSLVFPSTPLNTGSAAQTVTLMNTGSAALGISSIAITGGNAKDFSETNNCNSSVAAGASCGITVTFKPLLFGTRTSTLAITDNAPASPQTVPLSGMGMGPAVTLSATLINFGTQLATTTSAAQTVTLTNSGDEALTFSSITLAGTFTETNTCPSGSATLAAAASCTFSIAFAPLAGGPAVGLIEITDNASPVPQGITLEGTGADFSLSLSPTSGSVSPGASTSYTLTVTPIGGFSAAVSLSCSALPTGAACSFSPSSVTPSGSAAVTSSLTISTTGSGSAPGRHTRPSPPVGLAGLRLLWLLPALLAGLASVMAFEKRRPRFAVLAGMAAAALLLATLATPACGGGGSSSSATSTPAGTYMVLITGSTPAGTGSLQNPATATLVVE